MVVKQIYSLLNSMARQMWGEDATSVQDLSGVISMGKTVLSSDNEKDNFLGVLADRIGTTILRTLDLELDFPNMLRNTYEWGSIIQKINIQPINASEQKAWEVGANDFTPNQFEISKPIVNQTFFTNANAWEFDVTITDVSLKTAFTSAESFGAFVDGIMSAVSDSLTMSLNNMSYACIRNFVAEKLLNGNGVINVLEMFNAKFDKSYTLDDAILDREFYRFSGMVIRNVMKYMSKPSKLYNVGGMVRATQRDNMHVLVSSDFWSGYTTYLSADTFHDEMVNLDGFKEFVSLQGTGTETPDINDNTKIDIIPSSQDGKSVGQKIEVVGNGILAIITDREAMGIGYDDRFTAVDRNNRNRYSNYTSGCTVQYYNDISENGIVIIANNEGLSVDKTTLTFANSSADPQTITATTVPAGETVTWKSSKTSVATVSNGVVTPAGTGSCTITATSVINGQTYTSTTSVTVG